MTEDGQSITLRLFGTGGAFTRKYGTTCSELMFGQERWLIDCGRQAPDQLHAAGLSWHDIHGQLLTHVHGDHAFGLEDFAFCRYFYSERGQASVREGGPRPKLVCHSAVREELWQTLAASLRYVPPPSPPLSGSLETYFDVLHRVAEEAPRANPWRRAERYEAGPLKMWARESEHVPGKPSTSFEIEIGKGRLAWWSGDSTVDRELLVGLEPRTSVFFHDCTFVEYPGQVHGSFSMLEALPSAVRHKMVLMHHEDDLEEHRARAEALGFRIALPGHVYDLVTGQRTA